MMLYTAIHSGNCRGRGCGWGRSRSCRSGWWQIWHLYDFNAGGEAAPHTDYVSRRDIRVLFWLFREVALETQNFVNLI